MQMPLEIPESVQKKALATGQSGSEWLVGLERVVEDLAETWHFSPVRVLTGGTEALVAEVIGIDGRLAVLKILPPELKIGSSEIRVLLAAEGRGYPQVYEYDEDRGAMLLERLDQPLATLGFSIDQQMMIICDTLVGAWRIPDDPKGFTTGAEKARGLAEFTQTVWDELKRPCSRRVIDVALHFAGQRERKYAPESSVLGHGDAHPWNTLSVIGDAPGRFKFIDPDGLFIERAYDLAIPMREWSAELLAGDPLQLGIERCYRLADLVGIEPGPIWQWGYMERVSTALLCLKVGIPGGAEMLQVAESWAKLGEGHVLVRG